MTYDEKDAPVSLPDEETAETVDRKAMDKASALQPPHDSRTNAKPQETDATPPKRQQRLYLLSYQLRQVAHEWGACSDEAIKLFEATSDTYDSLSPKNGTDSIIARNIVGLNNLSMRLLAQSAPGRDEVRLKQTANVTKTLIELIRLYDGRRWARTKTEADGS